MDFGLSEDQREIQRTARDLLAERARWERVREHAEARSSDEALWRELCELGWPGIAVAEEYGGQGLGVVALSVLCEELGRVVAPVPFLPTVMAAALIEQAGSEEQRQRWLPGLASGETVGAVGVARDGVAELVIGGGEAGAIVLLEGESGRVLPASKAEVRAVDAIDPTRSAARVSGGEGAGEPLPGDVCGGIARALIAVSAELVGVSERALDMTVEYVKERKQFGVPVGSYQAVSHRCAQMLLDTERARSLTAFAAWSADADPASLAEAVAMAKAAASDAGREVTASAIQAHGGIGFTWEADIHWLYKRAQLDAALLGGAGFHRAQVARMLGRVGAAVPT
ncbi:MAG TPA: acyl-CoA dehydrogenase family protein [Solirubrobacteraceae bacterium]|jgi:alkylation response protein AidB-like acyl-CoA dehydrogenase